MSIAIEKASPVVGAEVLGVDTSVHASAETVEQLGRALAEHGVLIFRDQHLTAEQHIAFSSLFGSLETHVISGALLEGHPEVYVISNVVEDGKRKGRAYAGTYWHSDLRYTARRPWGRFVDMAKEESQPLLEYLFQHATQPAFIYRHRWQVNDLVFWDNRCTMHHAIRDYGDAPRHMHRTTICGDTPI